ncbi:unnamed protein product [Arabidopsis thaliana]|uniref:(thale cress) hypothetical protein n=1 Tax=Arabidopsis thaliana TaxID=3702 RepID=A0A7G2FFZ5_ARATH|nr:unnamed protein product [Arabidopsis thaliana]
MCRRVTARDTKHCLLVDSRTGRTLVATAGHELMPTCHPALSSSLASKNHTFMADGHYRFSASEYWSSLSTCLLPLVGQ